MFDFSWALVIYNWRGAWETEMANSVRNLGGGGGGGGGVGGGGVTSLYSSK